MSTLTERKGLAKRAIALRSKGLTFTQIEEELGHPPSRGKWARRLVKLAERERLGREVGIRPTAQKVPASAPDMLAAEMRQRISLISSMVAEQILQSEELHRGLVVKAVDEVIGALERLRDQWAANPTEVVASVPPASWPPETTHPQPTPQSQQPPPPSAMPTGGGKP